MYTCYIYSLAVEMSKPSAYRKLFNNYPCLHGDMTVGQRPDLDVLSGRWLEVMV